MKELSFWGDIMVGQESLRPFAFMDRVQSLEQAVDNLSETDPRKFMFENPRAPGDTEYHRAQEQYLREKLAQARRQLEEWNKFLRKM